MPKRLRSVTSMHLRFVPNGPQRLIRDRFANGVKGDGGIIRLKGDVSTCDNPRSQSPYPPTSGCFDFSGYGRKDAQPFHCGARGRIRTDNSSVPFCGPLFRERALTPASIYTFKGGGGIIRGGTTAQFAGTRTDNSFVPFFTIQRDSNR